MKTVGRFTHSISRFLTADSSYQKGKRFTNYSNIEYNTSQVTPYFIFGDKIILHGRNKKTHSRSQLVYLNGVYWSASSKTAVYILYVLLPCRKRHLRSPFRNGAYKSALKRVFNILNAQAIITHPMLSRSLMSLIYLHRKLICRLPRTALTRDGDFHRAQDNAITIFPPRR